MHPKSKDRKGNEKVLRTVRKDKRERDVDQGAAEGASRLSKRGLRMEALRKKHASDDEK